MTDFTFIGTFNPREGYGKATLQTVKALKRLGADFNTIPVRHKELIWPIEDKLKIDGLAFVWTMPEYWDRVEADELWGAFVWETTLLPQYRVDLINERATRLFTFSQWAAGMFADSGVTIPITVMPHGVSQAEYHYLKRNGRRHPYTFLLLGELSGRKGWDLAYTAFLEEFGGSPAVRLVMKTRGRCPLAPCADPNVEVIATEYGIPMMRELFKSADCFLFPSRGEGYGLPPREAAATGLPVIATDWSGLTEGGIANYAYPLKVKRMVKANYGYQGPEPCGDWADPDRNHLRFLMRAFFKNQKAVREMGKQAAEWIGEHCTWEAGARVLMEAANGYA